ncbi:SPW repeat protein [Kitasatospora sp. NPDC002227]|uniref:SPW repeat protein n=1 Tax=Kitasatospora sp. NPDC002227 TaxID=3154773 RepID=UPI00331754E2
MSTQLPMSMEHHPDIVELRERYERASVTPRAQAVEALSISAGLFLAISPWVVGYTTFSALTVCNLILGLGYAGLMAGYGSAFERTHARAWACTLIGAFTVIAPWAINGGAHVRRTILTNCITGGVMVCLALAAFGMTMTLMGTRRARSGG